MTFYRSNEMIVLQLILMLFCDSLYIGLVITTDVPLLPREALTVHNNEARKYIKTWWIFDFYGAKHKTLMKYNKFERAIKKNQIIITKGVPRVVYMNFWEKGHFDVETTMLRSNLVHHLLSYGLKCWLTMLNWTFIYLLDFTVCSSLRFWSTKIDLVNRYHDMQP